MSGNRNKLRWLPFSILNKLPSSIIEPLKKSNVYGVNDIFLPLYNEYHYMIDIWGSRGSGKSHCIADYTDYLLQGNEPCRIAFLRLHLDSVRDSMWLDFKDRLDERGETDRYKITDTTMRAECIETGNKVICKGVKASKSQTAKLKSLAGFTHVFIEEADEIAKEDFIKLIDSIRKVGVKIQIIRLFNTPIKTHHIWNDYNLQITEHEGYYMAHPKKESGIFAIHSTYNDNRHNLNENFLKRYDNAKDGSNLDYYLTNVKGLIPSGHVGQIYKDWQRISFDLYKQLDYNKYYYIDWGTRDPCAIGEVKIHNRNLFVKPLLYEPKEVIDIAKFLCDKGFTEKDIIICDSSEPNSILKLRNGYTADEIGQWEIDLRPQLARGFSTIGVAKPSGSVIEGISLLKEYTVHVVEGEEGDKVWAEYIDYRWHVDKNGNSTDQPIDKNNHHMDGIRYVPYMLPVIQ